MGKNNDNKPPESATSALDLSKLSSIEILGIYCSDILTACAVKLGLFDESQRDLAEARILIDSAAGLIQATSINIGAHHAAPLRDGLQKLQEAFREYSEIPDPPDEGPGEQQHPADKQ